ncbi:hypothetical protein ACOSQ4_020835 [Xanthoceras sorbifolium]
MDLVGPIIDILERLWNCTTRPRAYLCNFKENVESLRNVMRELDSVYEDVGQRVQREEQQDYYLRRTDRVMRWLRVARSSRARADSLLRRGDEEIQKKCLGNCRSRYKLGKAIDMMILEVRRIVISGHFDFVTEMLPRPPAEEIPLEKTVGIDSIFSQLWSCFPQGEDTNTEIIGLYGMGGVGKTTLLKQLNNNLFHEFRSAFDAVIWVVVSKEVNLWKIQEVIREKLGIADGTWKNKVNEHERAVEIFKILRQKKFVLLLDDLWEPINLASVGVPLDNTNGSKVVLTTRKEEVCGHMNAHKRFKVECLSAEASLDLFRLKVGEDVLSSHHELPKLAEIVVQECKGLPLVLLTVGGAMANWKTPEEWQRAIQLLRNYPFEVAGMDDHVFHKLRYSYDSLSDDTLKNCFLYCSLFPEDHNIVKDELIELWIGEGFLDKFDDIYDARNHGEYIIGRLKLACLLETGEYKNIIKMHDVLRDMALKLASEEGNKILVQERDGLFKPLGFPRWKDVKRISLWGPNIEFFGETPSCPDLLTFLVKNTKLKKFPSTFFQSMNALKVLDLSYNKDLTNLPVSIGELINLHHLNLSYTSLKVLPIEIKNLMQLRILLLDDTKNLEAIPTGVLLSLSSLEVFSRLLPTTVNVLHYDDIALLQELECLENISDVSLTLTTFRSVLKFKASSKLQCCIKRLTIMCSELETLDIPSSAMKRMEHLETLSIRDCHSLRELKISFEEQGRMQGLPDCFRNLRYLHIENCPIKDLAWIRYCPSLRFLWVDNCPSLEEIIADDFGSAEIEENIDMLSKLESINLVGLPSLKSICRRAMLLPSLKDVEVVNCPSLRKLPFDSDTAKNSLNAIKGIKTWWDQLEWEDAAAKDAFTSKFVDSNLVLFKPTAQSDYSKQLLRFK